MSRIRQGVFTTTRWHPKLCRGSVDSLLFRDGLAATSGPRTLHGRVRFLFLLFATRVRHRKRENYSCE
jgi:hypothetical protein